MSEARQEDSSSDHSLLFPMDWTWDISAQHPETSDNLTGRLDTRSALTARYAHLANDPLKATAIRIGEQDRRSLRVISIVTTCGAVPSRFLKRCPAMHVVQIIIQDTIYLGAEGQPFLRAQMRPDLRASDIMHCPQVSQRARRRPEALPCPLRSRRWARSRD